MRETVLLFDSVLHIPCTPNPFSNLKILRSAIA